MVIVELIKKYKKIAISILVVAVIVVLFVLNSAGDDSGIETQEVTRTDVEKLVEETGTVEAPQDADLSFEGSGSVSNIYVSKGDAVSEGEPLIKLNDSEEYSNVLSAQAALKTEEATLADLRANTRSSSRPGSSLYTTESQQRALIENARRKLLSDGLVARPFDEDTTLETPTISGSYFGDEGTYEFYITPSNIGGTFNLYTTGLKNTGPVKINETNPTPLGTKGLYISLSDSVRAYSGTKWYVEIPNTKSDSYLTNLNAYIAARESAQTTLVNTEVTNEKIQSQEARVDQARASLALTNARLSKRTLRAPFSGRVTDVNVTLGETVTPGNSVVSLISDSQFEITVDIPESDIASVSVGDTAEITFDAYDSEEFLGRVTFINPSAKTVDSVSTFETTLQFDEPDPKIKVGLSADVEILAEIREDVLAIPSRAVIEKSDNGKIVRQIKDGELVETPIETGLRGSLGLIEVTEGLEEGEEVITFISDKALEEFGVEN